MIETLSETVILPIAGVILAIVMTLELNVTGMNYSSIL